MMFGSDQRCWWCRRPVPMKDDGGGGRLKMMILAWVWTLKHGFHLVDGFERNSGDGVGIN